jgi:hypothetical protein
MARLKDYIMRQFVLVTAVHTGSTTTSGSGIRKLKRGNDFREFVVTHLETEAALKTGEYSLYERGSSYTASFVNGAGTFTFVFTLYPEDDLLTAVSHLTKEELLRDLKELLPLKADLA